MAEFYRKKKKICQMCAGKSVDYKDETSVGRYNAEDCMIVSVQKVQSARAQGI